MLNSIKELFNILNGDQKKRLYKLQILVVVMAFFEVVSIALMAPFMSLVGDLGLIKGSSYLASLYRLSGINSPVTFLIYSGILLLVMLVLTAIVSTYTVWKLSFYSTRVGTEIADSLFEYYIKQNWIYHLNVNSSELTKRISTESQRVTSDIIQPLLQMNAKLMLVLFIVVGMIIYNPLVTFAGFIIFVGSYVLLYKIVRSKLEINGDDISNINAKRFKLMSEGFGGIKEILLLGCGGFFINQFRKSGKILSAAQASNIALSQVPRYFMELLSFGSIILITLILLKKYEGNIGLILPIISVYAMAGFKLLPAIQHVYASFSHIKGNLSALNFIKNDLKLHLNSIDTRTILNLHDKEILLEREMLLKNIFFTYPGKNEPVLKDLTLSIPANKVVGIVGLSGSGKTTILNVLLGLIKPQKGILIVDGNEVNFSNLRNWQNSIGFVAQDIFLTDATIAENIAFGVPYEQIDFDQVHATLLMSNLDKFILDLKDGINSKVGERGLRLSGGQRQRIGIARALYKNARLLVFDEATSSLDGITEKLIMEAIHNFSGNKTIVIVAHRLKTVENCDIIFIINKGEVAGCGTYKELLEKNDYFRKMAGVT